MYVYKMYVEDKLCYIGHTSNIKNRISTHYSIDSHYDSKVLTQDQIKMVTKILYAEMGSADARILEAYLIAKDKPVWNKDFVEDDDLTFEITTNRSLVWKEYPVTWDDNPDHSILVWKEGTLLYEIPKIHAVYDELCKKLGIEQDMNFGFCTPVYAGEYKLMRLTNKRRVKNGSMKQMPKYIFMGYPKYKK